MALPRTGDSATEPQNGHEGASSMRPRAVRAIGVKVQVGISQEKLSVSGF